MRVFAFSLFMLFSACILPANAADAEYDVGKVRWGMTMEEVMATEPGEPVKKSKGFLEYTIRLLDTNTDVLYFFENFDSKGGLVRVWYFMRPDTRLEQMRVYGELFWILSNKFPAPPLPLSCEGNALLYGRRVCYRAVYNFLKRNGRQAILGDGQMVDHLR